MSEAVVEKMDVGLNDFLFISSVAAAIIGLFVVLASVLYMVFYQVSAYDPPTAYVPLSAIGLGVCLMTGGCGLMAVERKALTLAITLFGLSLISPAISLAGYPSSWTYPALGYLLSFFVVCQVALVAIIFMGMAKKKQSQPLQAKPAADIAIDEEPVSLKYWPDAASVDAVDTLMSKTATLIQAAETLKNENDKLNNSLFSQKKENFLKLIDTVEALDRIFDNVERQNMELDERARILLNNFKTIRKKLARDLNNEGVRAIESDVFEEGKHVITETREVYGLKDYTVIETTIKGYMWNDEVLRKAEVIVVKNGR